MKTCTKCNIEKPTVEFHRDNAAKDKLHGWCKPCKIRSRLDWHEKNKHKDAASKKKYATSHPDRIKRNIEKLLAENPRYFADKEKEYRDRNKEKLAIKRRKVDKERRELEPLFKLRRSASNNISGAVSRGGYKSLSKTAQLLGCDWPKFKAYLESKFQLGMDWSNYGEWELDHIVACLTAKSIQELEKLQHYTNFQPLWKDDHKIKTKKDIKAKGLV